MMHFASTLLLAPLALIVPSPRCGTPWMAIEGSGVQRLRDATRNLPKHKIALPPELKRMGCDDELWGKIRAKKAFIRLIDAGDEEGAKARLEQVRNAPSVTGNDQWEMPAVLGEWGCDADMWSVLRSKRQLLELARVGDAVAGKQKVATLKLAIAKEAAAAPAEAAAPTPAKAEKKTAPRSPRSGGQAKVLDAYTLAGEPPAGADVAAIEALLAKRVEAKRTKDYETADGLQAELEGMGVYCNDRLRTWSGCRPTRLEGVQ